MASGYCVRVFLLSLLAFGPHAKALSYRGGGSSIIKPYFAQAEGFSGSHKPGSASPKYESPAQPGGFIGSSVPSYPNTGSFENLKPAGAGGYSGSYGRQVDGYSPDGSVSSYRRSKPRDNPQQPHFKTQLNAKGVLQTKAGMWDVASPQDGNRFDSGIASSHGIEMASGHQSETRPQKPSYPAQPRPQQPSYPGKPQPRPQQPSYPGKPQPRPQQPSYLGYPGKPQPQQPSYPGKPQPRPQPSYPGKPQLQPRSQQPSYPGKPQPRPQRPSYPVQPQPRPQRPSYPAQPQPQPRPQHPSYPAQPQPQPRPQRPSYPAQPQPQPRPQRPSYPGQPQPSYPAQPQPEQPSYLGKPPLRPQQPSYLGKPQQPSYLSKLRPHPQLHLQSRPDQPSFDMTQSKAGMWDSRPSQGGDAYDSIEKSTNSEIQPRSYGSLRYWGYI
ncbi:basic salivary proline-rich protein 3-like [Seriola lalandi dorsalis]|uniref:basic salivary proline-rich protein 3-like n=1 Tax=Seriola lalandi dorsalis TaxID=1841481 RepID=UPI000C6F5402|nr:basic salivary proline-rich protein 3-like [Seriola lalandi dorsalis]